MQLGGESGSPSPRCPRGPIGVALTPDAVALLLFAGALPSASGVDTAPPYDPPRLPAISTTPSDGSPSSMASSNCCPVERMSAAGGRHTVPELSRPTVLRNWSTIPRTESESCMVVRGEEPVGTRRSHAGATGEGLASFAAGGDPPASPPEGTERGAPSERGECTTVTLNSPMHDGS